ncbi:MAG: VOC family protein [Janthinobacterium lividum]
MTPLPKPPEGAAASKGLGGLNGRILRLSRNVQQLARSTAFYETRLGFVRYGPPETLASTLAGLWGPSNRLLERQRLRLGTSELELVGVGDVGGASYPADSRADDLWFQHFAIRCPDLEQAFSRLYRPGPAAPLPQAITRGEDGAPCPILLPARSGGVTAFKFRDPDGHPVELLGFPAPLGMGADTRQAGIDHSAISVANAAASIRFYHQWLGFTADAQQRNAGIEQARLDGVPGARVDVVALQSSSGGAPHLELLGYHPAPGDGKRGANKADGPSDIASDRLVIQVEDLDALRHAWRAAALPIEASSPDALLVRDPDRHLLMLTR